ncbi:DUF4272 domain-containing protein [Roseiconus nitratireducens]|uniref:DUF4272 domain-containing protein n=1 Tax=Roseiconus nitratireducens TaxID=2605748 RepID=A0A5M6DLZ1_9BACT|nr:DUF4272 domain-containing protein [Roseiconus nitratireducens]KAA5547239.1 DUF4272 domain-containing protein [Roseiconus nitratireducens]
MPVEIFAYCTHRQPPPIEFPHEPVFIRDDATPGFSDHLIKLVTDLFESAGESISPALYALCRHVQRTNVLVAFKVDGEHLEAIAPWAWDSNAILFLPDRSIRDPNGAKLYDPDSQGPDPDAQIPFLPDARQRKAQSELQLRNRLINTPETLPPVVSELEVTMRPPDEVAWRMLALFIVAVRAESLASGKPIPTEALREKSPLAFQGLSPWEQQFLQSESPDSQDVVAAGWRYEALAALQWACQLQPTLPFPDAICDVPETARRMIAQSERELIESIQLRPTDQILDGLDLNFRLLWAAREAIQKQQTPPAGLEGGVITERQHALNWLTCFEHADWDDVDIPS